MYELKESPIVLNDEEIEELWKLVPSSNQYCMMYGKRVCVPRKYAIYGVNYKFGGEANGSSEVPEILKRYEAYGNSILVNWYEDGSQYIGYHSDDERGVSGSTYGFTYGSERRFKIQKKSTKEVTTLNLENNSLLIMKEGMQREYKHSLPIMKKSGRRVSITVRTLRE